MLSSGNVTEGFAVPGKRLVSLVFGAFMGVLAMNTDASAQSRRDAQDVLQLLLDSRELGQYFHFDADPQRVPLRILDASGLAADAPSLTAAGRKVVIAKDKDPRALEIRSLVIAGDSAGSRGSTQSAAVRELPVSCSLGSRQRKR